MARARRALEPACRCCGCTQDNACAEGCEWVRVPAGEPPLCSACNGTTPDATYVVERVLSAIRKYRVAHPAKTLRALLKRMRARTAEDARLSDHG